MDKAAIDRARAIIADGEKAEDPVWFIDNDVLGGWKEALDEVERLRGIIQPLIGDGSDAPESGNYPAHRGEPNIPRQASEPSTGRVPVLWFDARGCGPDQFYLEIHPFKEIRDGEDLVAEASLGLRLRAGDLVIVGRGMIDGGFNHAYPVDTQRIHG